MASEPTLTVVNFHRIRAHASQAAAFDDEVFGPTAEEFRAQVRWLRANAELISEDDLVRALERKGKLPRRSALITFDDGYIDNYELALPVLRELSAPAIFFIPTQAIEERVLGWWDQIAYLLKRTDRSELKLGGECFAVGAVGRARLKEVFQERMKLWGAERTRGLVEELSEACGVALPGREECGRELMSWDQLREVAQEGAVALGSHTRTHRVLATLSLAEQKRELLRSKEELEAKVGRPIRTLAYPVGGYEHFNAETRELARQCGYAAAFSFHTGINRARRLEPHDLRRISAPERLDLYPGIFALPQVFAARKCAALAPVPAAEPPQEVGRA